MIDTKCITRKFTIKGINVTIKPLYSMGYFEGYTATAGNTTQTYFSYHNRRFFKYTPFGLDHYITAENIAYDFIDYYYPATKKDFLEV